MRKPSRRWRWGPRKTQGGGRQAGGKQGGREAGGSEPVITQVTGRRSEGTGPPESEHGAGHQVTLGWALGWF